MLKDFSFLPSYDVLGLISLPGPKRGQLGRLLLAKVQNNEVSPGFEKFTTGVEGQAGFQVGCLSG